MTAHRVSRKALTNPFLLFQNPEQSLSNILQSLLNSPTHSSNLHHVKQIHANSIINGVTNNGLLGAKVLGMYVLSESFTDAKKCFFQLKLSYFAMPWNWMIRGFNKVGHFDFALLFYFKMLGCGVFPDKYTFPPVIKACGGLNNVRLGMVVHDMMLSMGFDVDEFVGSSLIKLYAESGCVEDAYRLFGEMPKKDCVLWNVMLNGFVKCGELVSALKVFRDMRNCETKPNSTTFASVVSVCASEGMREFGNQLHGLVISCGFQFDPLTGNALVAMYSKFGQLSDAQKLFGILPETSAVTWNGMIAGYVQNGFLHEASFLFSEMMSAGVKPDAITFASFLPSVTESASLKHGKEIHGYIVRHGITLDVFLKSALIDIYFKCRDVEMACKIFNQSTNVDIVVCTAMISGYVLNGRCNDALELFRWLLEEKMSPNAVTLASVIPACAGLAALKLGKELHANILKHRLDERCHVGSAIVDMYAKCGRLDLAHQVFKRMPEKDSVCWNAIIANCSQNGKPQEAIDLFRQMGMEGMSYDCVSISAALSASANLPALYYGKAIHSFMIKGAFKSDIFAESALIDMYGKCGNLNTASRVFDMMQEKNEVSWNNVISAYGSHGQLDVSLSLFRKMLEDGIRPDHVTFLTILSACGHSGQVDKAIQYFRCMTEEYRIPAQMEHYACMVDLYGRAGRFSEAFETIKSMPFLPDNGIWGTLMGACHLHGNVELAEVASRHLLDMDPDNSGSYVLLSNIHACAGKWGSVRKIRSLMKERGVNKVPGCSWIEVHNTTHMFVAADGSHPQSAQIYSVLDNVLSELRKEGYVAKSYLQMHPQILGCAH
ncbi:pentatricopeptide repeat-containing protein At4g21300 [Mercurialis annua]|uniref:pentatricopeptide repeat-containing protein At4g21300 n=1 Tax=Mercurialis annua TaxID=3986 RepID=UPI00215F3360|nr:pentatricopeptide repeat-containing protein At4g21300 [Mercurialis annua]XP_050220612.1 pentatricopeptide repeat-containing protein At4g21300 [Mercurialis annua]